MGIRVDIIYVLVFNEWDGGGGEISENITSSHNLETIVAYKKDLVDKSLILRKKIAELEAEKEAVLKPIWDDLNPILRQQQNGPWKGLLLEDRQALIAKKNKLVETCGLIHQRCYKKKDEYMNNLGVSHYIDDPDLASFTIEELEVI